jgi:hypothetical protein
MWFFRPNDSSPSFHRGRETSAKTSSPVKLQVVLQPAIPLLDCLSPLLFIRFKPLATIGSCAVLRLFVRWINHQFVDTECNSNKLNLKWQSLSDQSLLTTLGISALSQKAKLDDCQVVNLNKLVKLLLSPVAVARNGVFAWGFAVCHSSYDIAVCGRRCLCFRKQRSSAKVCLIPES